MDSKLSDLKEINETDYQKNISEINSKDGEGIVNFHILSKMEIEQIETYSNNKNFYISNNTIGIEALTIELYTSVKNKSEILNIDKTSKNMTKNTGEEENILVEESLNENQEQEQNQEQNQEQEQEQEQNITSSSNVYLYINSEYPNGVPIPEGYKYYDDNGIISICDKENKNLVYIWVPLEESRIDTVKDELKSLYENYKDRNGDGLQGFEESFNNTSEEISQEFRDSISQYGGFYISEAEMGYDKDQVFYNKARGMVQSTATKTAVGGDYFRGSTTEGFTYDNIISIIDKITEGNSSVKGHLTYGIEWDATVLWIKENYTNYKDDSGNDIQTILIKDSTLVGKYTNTSLRSTSTAEESSAYFNGIWGLGGNLAELTQERSGSSYVIRGGSWNETGENAPIATRQITNEISNDMIGFRTCLYVIPNQNVITISPGTYTPIKNDDTTKKIGNDTFDILGEVIEYANTWDGLKVYRDVDENSDVVETYGFANVVTVTAKAKTDTNSDWTWVELKLSDGSIGYANGKKLIDKTEIINGYKFVISDNKVLRYHNGNFVIYSKPDTNGEIKETKDNKGSVEVIGKSVDQEWAIIDINGQRGYVKANDLRATTDLEENDGYQFYTGDRVQRIITNKEGASIYNNAKENEIISKIEYGTEIIVLGYSTDGKMAKIEYNEKDYFISAEDISLPGPTVELKNIDESTGDITIWVLDNGKGISLVSIKTQNGEVVQEANENELLKLKDGYYEVKFNVTKSGKYIIESQDKEGNVGFYSNNNVGIKSITPIEIVETKKMYLYEIEHYNPDYSGHTVNLTESQYLKVCRSAYGEQEGGNYEMYVGLCQYIRDYIDYGSLKQRTYDSLGSFWLKRGGDTSKVPSYKNVSWFKENKSELIEAVEYVFGQGGSLAQKKQCFYYDDDDAALDGGESAALRVLINASGCWKKHSLHDTVKTVVDANEWSVFCYGY